MRGRLYSPASGLRVDHEFTDEVTVGRGASNSLTLQSRLLSGSHVRIRWDEGLGCYRLQDMGSTNGTRLDGRRVEDALLGHLHVVTLADQLDIVFQDLERCAARSQARAEARSAEDSAPMKAPGAPSGPAISEKTQHTSIQSLAMALPELLRAPGAQPASTPSEGSQVSDGTMLERLPLPLPAFLQKNEEGPIDAPGADAPRPRDAVTDDVDDAAPLPASSAILPSAAEKGRLRATVEVPPTRDMSSGSFRDSAAGFVPTKPHPGQKDIFFLAAHTSAGTVYYELQEGTNLIGRSHDAEVQIDSPEVSRRHAQLALRDGRMTLRDLGSRNRTFVNGEPLAKEPVNVMPGQRLRFGALEVVLGVTAAEPPPGGAR